MATTDSMLPDTCLNTLRDMVQELGFSEGQNSPESLPTQYGTEFAQDKGDFILFCRIMRPENTFPYLRISPVKQYTQPLSSKQQGIIRYYRTIELYGRIVCYNMTPELSQEIFHLKEKPFEGTRSILYYHHNIDLYDFPQSLPSESAIQTIITCMTKQFQKVLDAVEKAGKKEEDPRMI
jgi:hypothetical protein